MRQIIRDRLQDAYIDETRALRVQAENSSQFGEFLTVGRTPIIELNSAYGTSTLRDEVTLAGTGAKDDVNGTITTGEIELSTGTTASSSALLESAGIARYIPGYSAEMGMGVRLPSAPTGDQEIRFGGRTIDENNGFYWIYDTTGLGVVVEKGGTETIVYQSNWNVDPLDGTGESGVTLDLTKGYIFQIDYTWYGYGAIKFSVIATASGLLQRPVPCHIVSVSEFSGTSINDPSLRIFQEVKNNTTAADITMYVGGRQYSIVGKYVPKYRFTGDYRASTTVSTTPEPLVSFRIKSGFRNRSIKLDGFNAENTGNTTAFLEVWIDGTLTSPTWGTPGNYTAADTALESDTVASAISGGSVIYPPQILPPSKDANFNLGELNLDLPEVSTISLVAYTLSGSTNIVSTLQLREEW